MSLAWTRYDFSAGLPIASLSCSRSCAVTQLFAQELLQMVPQPVVAVLFLFPVTKESEAAKEAGTPIGLPTLRSCMLDCAKCLVNNQCGALEYTK